jgi:Zn-dependent protease
MDILSIATKAAVYFVPFLFSLCFHEVAHGLVAKWKGDNTATMMGRLTMNPLVHMDVIGTFFLPLLAIIFNLPIFFGWAKPVPVNERNLKNPKKDMFWIALAGPLSNVFLAFVGSFALAFAAKYLRTTEVFTGSIELLKVFISINLFLAVFNIIPLHPLDGGKVIARFLPAEWNYRLEKNENVTSLILMFLIMSGAMRFLSIPVQLGYEVLINLALRFF